MIWHYTTYRNFEEIERDGFIRPTDLRIDAGERPAIWLSSNPHWESTANKALQEKTGEISALTMEGTHLTSGGLIRIGVEESILMGWTGFLRVSGVSKKTVKGLKLAAAECGSNCYEWFVSFDPIPREKWSAVEKWDGKRWVKWDGEPVELPPLPSQPRKEWFAR